MDPTNMFLAFLSILVVVIIYVIRTLILNFRSIRLPPRTIPPLPDDILVEILSKLPVKSVLICRCVCRNWKALTSTPEFVELHLKKKNKRVDPPTMLILQRSNTYGFDGDDWNDHISWVDYWGATKRRTRTRKINLIQSQLLFNPDKFLYACNGLLIFLEDVIRFRQSSPFSFYSIFNPTTREKVRLVTPRGGSIYGIFFHPSLNRPQYCLLWGGKLRPKNGRVQISILDLDWSKSKHHYSQPQKLCWRDLPDDHDAPISYTPRLNSPPVIVNGILYWMVGYRYATSTHNSSRPCTQLADSCEESIMAFNPKTEKFSVMSHPGSPQDKILCQWDNRHSTMNVVDTDDHGLLCLCKIHDIYRKPSINIWILKHQQPPFLWIKWLEVDISMNVRRYPFYGSSSSRYLVRPVAIIGGELFVEWRERGLFAIDLRPGNKVKRFEGRIKNERDSRMYFHIHSLVPIRKTKLTRHENNYKRIWNTN
ncbi:hypothetical protein ACH5RR_035864 [Cinchona calisaya]|uniref:F-box domain-containing protein n=1 Tax=Cinchona calisaya TaxID=153742 RepID=A0ABD2Y6H5_9GENT